MSAIVGLIAGAISLGTSIYGAVKNAKANKAREKEIGRRRDSLQDWYDKEYHQDYLDTSEARSSIRMMQEQMRDRKKATDQNNIVSGATDETKVATADKLNRNYGNTLTQLAGYGTRRKDALTQNYQAQQYNLDNIYFGLLGEKSQNWNNLSQNGMNAFSSVMAADSNGAFDKWDNSISGWFKGRGGASSGSALAGRPLETIKTVSTPDRLKYK